MPANGAATAMAAGRRPSIATESTVTWASLAALVLFLLVTIVLPLYALLSKSFQDQTGAFIGIANYAAYFSNPALFQSIGNSFVIAVISTAMTTVFAFAFAYGLSRTCMPAKGMFRAIAAIPILAPSLLPGIALVYLFGNQGLLKSWMMGASIYGPIGIVIGMVFFTLPHAVMIL